jgi:hypothetical protein
VTVVVNGKIANKFYLKPGEHFVEVHSQSLSVFSPLSVEDLEVILVGDFYQLPPVSNEMYGDFAHYCFEAEWFANMFPHMKGN